MKIPILTIPISLTSCQDASRRAVEWTWNAESRAIFAANVHMLMEAHDSPDFRSLLQRADLVTPDGMPLVWIMRLKGARGQQRVYGPTLMLYTLEAATNLGIPVGFYGSTPATLEALLIRLGTRFPGLKVAYTYCPPFGALSDEEDAQIIEQIRKSGTRILFVGLGCPKQERWIMVHRGHLPAVMIGVGAAFDFHAGIKPQAPGWMQRAGLEWLFRFAHEPARLWRRYLWHNPRFIALAMLDLLGLYRM